MHATVASGVWHFVLTQAACCPVRGTRGREQSFGSAGSTWQEGSDRAAGMPGSATLSA